MMPVYIKPYPDELMYSWICRLAKANGLSLRDFYNAHLGSVRRQGGTLIYDLHTLFFPLSRQIAQPFDPQELYLSVTTLACESVRLSYSLLNRYVTNSFQPAGRLNKSTKFLFRDIYVCPECVREDAEKYGEAYLHRAHHLNGVCVCHKHAIPLLKYHKPESCKNKTMANAEELINRQCVMRFNMNDYEEVAVSVPLEAAVAYAKYTNEILQAGVVTDYDKVLLVIINKLKEMDLDYEQLFDKISCWKYVSLFGDIECLRKKFLYEKDRNPIEIFMFLMVLFPDPADAIAAFKEQGTNLRTLTCPDCGHVYCSTSKILWPCPKCSSRMSDQELFETVVSTVENGRYVPLSPFKSIVSNVLFLDTDTGEERAISPKKFLYQGVRVSPALAHRWERRWEFVYALYLRYIAETGTGYVPSELVYEGQCLGVWFFWQRKMEREGRLLPYRKEKLLAAVPDFFSDELVHERINSPVLKHKHNDSWEAHRQLCLRYIEQSGSSHIPWNTLFEGHEIGYWAAHQRYLYSKNRLLPEREQKLLEMDPEFFSIGAAARRALTETDALAKTWNYKCHLYEQCVHEWGTLHIPYDAVYKGERIGVWLSTQYQRERQSKLLPERKARLLAIDPDFFSPDVRKKRSIEDRQWVEMDRLLEERLDLYAQYIKEKGTPYVPYCEVYHGVALGDWIARQRKYYRDGTLSQKRIKRLLELDPYFFSPEVIEKRKKENIRHKK